MTKSRELNSEQVEFVNMLIGWASPLAAGYKPSPFRILGLEPTAYLPDIEHAAQHRLEVLGQTRLIAFDLELFPPVVALAHVLEGRVRLRLKALKNHHRAGTLAAYAESCRQRWSGALVDLVPSRSATTAGVQAEAQDPRGRPRGGFSKWG